MNVNDILQQAGGIGAIATQLGVSPETAQKGAEALLPAVLGGFQKQSATESGAAGLGGLIGQLGGGGLLDSVLGLQPAPAAQGNDILGQIFGSKDVSRDVAGQAATSTGLDRGLLQKMLPLLSMLVAGYLAKQGGAAAGQAGGLGGLLGGGAAGSATGGASSGGVLGGLGKMLDRNGDGNPLDDILGMASKFRK